MKRRRFLQASSVFVMTPLALQAAAAATHRYDVLVYGTTPGGLAAALEAARRGLRVALICPKRHPGGMTASGLSTTDAVRTEVFGGVVAEFVGRVRKLYETRLGEAHPQWPMIKDGWFYEPSVAQLVFEEMLAEQEERLHHMPGWHLSVERLHRLAHQHQLSGRQLDLARSGPASSRAA